MSKLDRCIEIICNINGVSPSAFQSTLKIEEVARARHIAYWYFSDKQLFSLTRIGNIFGNVAHCSVLYGRNKINTAFDINDKRVLFFVNECKRQLDEYLPGYVTAKWFESNELFCDTESIEIKTTNILELWK